jgi:hypothetical protein
MRRSAIKEGAVLNQVLYALTDQDLSRTTSSQAAVGGLSPYSPNRVEWVFSEVGFPLYGVLRSSHSLNSAKFAVARWAIRVGRSSSGRGYAEKGSEF